MPLTFSAATREEAVAIACEVIAKQPVYLDTETTGLDQNDEIIEISIIDHAGTVLLESLVRPTIPIPSDSTCIHGISDSSVKQSPFWNTIWPRVREILTNRVVCSYNSDFDARMIQQSLHKFRLPWNITHSFFDIMGLFSVFNNDWDPIYRSYKLIKLEDAGKRFGIQIPNSHRALDDTRLARAVLHSIAGILY
jgi:DNA polymerase-3 subunit epsilon